MMVRPSKSVLPVSRRMLAASLLLHGVLIGALIYFGYHGITKREEPQLKVTPVKIVAVSEGVPDLQKLDPAPAAVPAPAAEPVIKDAGRTPPDSSARPDLIEAYTIKPKKQRRIRVKKRKRPIRTVEAPKPKPEKEKPQPKDKKEDPRTHVEKQIAKFRERREAKLREQPAQTGLKAASTQDPAEENRELLLWFGAIREQINDRWAVIRGATTEKRVTVVGCEISQDGALLNATVIASSGYRLFDISALRAVHQAAPFPAIPPRVWERIRKEGGLELSFNSGGLVE